jgi:DNA-binding MarR family transcriptional regulator
MEKSQAPRRSRADQTDIRRRAWRAIMETHARVTALLEEEMQQEIGLDIPTYDTLLRTYEAGHLGIRMTDLAEIILFSKSGLTTMADRLEKRGLLKRIPDPDDRRAIRITLTEQGVETFRRAAKVHVAGIQRHVADRLTNEEARVIAQALERIRQDGSPPT